MDKTLFLCGFALIIGIWNIWEFRTKRGPWLWTGIALTLSAIVVLALFFQGIRVFP